jgi:ubiquinol-cytochrome c reductase cytochrome b subunit
MGKIKDWIEDRTGLVSLTKNIMEHPVPENARWWYVFGSATLACFLIQVFTGIGLAIMYQPSSSTAYDSLLYIENKAVLGSWLRGIHYFGASGMILLMGMHMLRVYLMAAYKYPREVSWISGVLLLVLTIMMGFTGQLLRWDDNGVWSAVVAAEQMGRIPIVGRMLADFMLGGGTIGGHTLSRFFSFHVFLVPAFLFMFIGLHLYLVIKNGISEPPEAGRLVDPKTYKQWYENLLKKSGVPFYPFAIWRDVVFGTAVIFVILLLAFFIGAPAIKGPPNPAAINVSPQPDWYLLWIFALFALMPPEIESYVIIIGPVLLIVILLSLPFLSNKGERSPLRRPWAMAGSIMTVTIIGGFWYEGNKSPWSPDFNAKPLPASLYANANKNIEKGAQLFYTKGCLYCHKINDLGGMRGPDLTKVEKRLTKQEMTIRIINGGSNMPSFGGSLTKEELEVLVEFLKSNKKIVENKLD